jgi:hypothetical protein
MPDEANTIAFNEGSDARILGIPISANPYKNEDRGMAGYWENGWWHVQAKRGRDARWPVRPLPEVSFA